MIINRKPITNDELWMSNYQDVMHYQNEHGQLPKAPNKDSKTHEGVIISNWISAQRTAYRKGKLSEEKKTLLEKIPNWCWDLYEKHWDEKLLALKDYIKQHGFLPPKITGDHYCILGNWVFRQKIYYRTGILHKSRVEKLEMIPEWTWTSEK
ncbi:MAG: helicase associated domain-containing protein [Paraclostridium sp.]